MSEKCPKCGGAGAYYACYGDQMDRCLTSCEECGHAGVKAERDRLRRQLAQAKLGHDLMTEEDCHKKHPDPDFDHSRCVTCGQGLSFCKRCYGGEAQLDEPCVERLAHKSIQKSKDIGGLLAKLVIKEQKIGHLKTIVEKLKGTLADALPLLRDAAANNSECLGLAISDNAAHPIVDEMIFRFTETLAVVEAEKGDGDGR